MTKSDIRREMLLKRDSLKPMEANLLGNTILDNLTATDEYKKAGIIFAYASYRNEADTMGLITRALDDGKRIALPCSYMSGGEPKMDFYFINGLTDLVSGYKGILEPDRRKESIKKTDDIPDMFIIPGVAFDSNFNRIGYGKGFYDKYLSLHNFGNNRSNYYNNYNNNNDNNNSNADNSKHPMLVGLCYSFQMTHDIPADENDVRMDMLVTESGVMKRL